VNATLHLVVTMVLCALAVHPLAAARWVWRSPRTGILLWQLLGLTFLLCAVGAALTHGLAPYDRDVPTAMARLLAGAPVSLGPDRTAALIAAAVLTVVLLAMIAGSWLAVLRTRRRHRDVLSMVAREDPAAPGALILDHPVTVAYCLPGRRSTVVLSSGALATLSPDELAAVLAHEHTHARERHDLVLLPFTALRRLPLVGVAAEAVALLVEMRADEGACRAGRAGELATALRRFGDAGPPAGAMAMADRAVAARLHRLTSDEPLSRGVRYLVLTAGAVLVSTPLSFLMI
jgi:Zn-dependent protease with chaperone function